MLIRTSAKRARFVFAVCHMKVTMSNFVVNFGAADGECGSEEARTQIAYDMLGRMPITWF